MAAAILVALVAGAVFGWMAPEVALNLGIVTSIFLRLIRAIIAPLLFGVLVSAIAEAGGLRGLGRIGWRAFLYFEATTTVALVLGWLIVAVPGLGRGVAFAGGAAPAKASSLGELVTDAFPASIFDSMAKGDIVPILFFCFLFGAAAGAAGERASAVVDFARALTAICFEFTRRIMWLAPAAVFAAMAGTVAAQAGSTLAALGGFIVAAWCAQAIFFCLAIVGSVWLARVPWRDFFRAVEEPFLVAFATTSSAAALPKVLEAMERLGVSRKIYGIVSPLSVSLNLCGSCVHLAMCAAFAANAAGMTLGVGQQLMILLALKLTSKGVAGIPRANFIILSGLFPAFGLPLGMLPVLLGIDALIDPVRTGVNVLSHCAAPPLVARWEKR